MRPRQLNTANLLVAIVLAAVAAQPAHSQTALATGTPQLTAAGTQASIAIDIINVGTVAAANVMVASATYGGASASGLPLALGGLTPGAIANATITVGNSGLVSGKTYLLTLHGTYVSGGTAYGFALNRYVALQLSPPLIPPPHPLDVVATPDATHAVTQTISVRTGGTVSATGADGTRFTLTIPANALLGDEDITLTPVLMVDGVPLSGGVAAAVQLGPEGLQLQQVARLTITPLVGTSHPVGFAYRGVGTDFSLYPLNLGGIDGFAILHFSGYGLGGGSETEPVVPANEQAAVLDQIAKAPATTLQQLVTEEEDLIQFFYTIYLKPTLDDALEKDATVPQMVNALNNISAFMRELLLLGLDGDGKFPDEINLVQAQFVPLIVAIFNRTYSTLCVEPGVAASHTMLGMARDLQLMGVDVDKVLGPDWLEKIEKCAIHQLTVDFDSDLQSSFNSPEGLAGLGSSNSIVQARGVILNFNAAIGPGFDYEGSGPLNYSSLTFTLEPHFCTALDSNSPGTLSASVFPDPNLIDPPSEFLIRVSLRATSFETFQPRFIIPSVGCVQGSNPANLHLYEDGFRIVGGGEFFPMHMDTPKVFTGRSGKLTEGPFEWQAKELTTTITIKAVK